MCERAIDFCDWYPPCVQVMEMLGEGESGGGGEPEWAQQVLSKCLVRARNLASALQALHAFKTGAREFAACFDASMESGHCRSFELTKPLLGAY